MSLFEEKNNMQMKHGLEREEKINTVSIIPSMNYNSTLKDNNHAKIRFLKFTMLIGHLSEVSIV